MVAAAALVGCARTSAPSSGALDASEAGRAGTDDSDDGEADDAPDLDADATLPLDGPTTDAGWAPDIYVDVESDASIETGPAEESIPDDGSPRDAAWEDAEESGTDARGPSVDAAGPLDAPSDMDAPRDVVEGNEASADGLPSTAPCLTGGQSGAADGVVWILNFNTWNTMTRMQTGVVYDVATVSSGGSFAYTRATCGATAGTFRVDEFETPDASIGGVSMLLGFTAAFAITCDGYPGVLRGCVHF